MSEFFTYEFRKGGRRIHVHFVPPEQTEPHRIVERYVDFQNNHGSPDELVFLGFEFASDLISEVLAGDDLQARRPTLMPLKGGSFRGLVFRVDGRLVEVATKALVDITELAELRTQGMLAIFSKRSGMIETTPSFHYVKPSGQHVERFVRTSNTLVCGAEVKFMAAWLSPLLGPEVRVVHCDTSGIASLAHAAVAIRGQFDRDVRVIAVDSFGSYSGLKSNSLRDTTSAVVLISASTSGNMARKIAAGGVPHSSVVTIFYLGTEKPGHPVLCDLRSGGYEPVVNYVDADCPLCVGGSIALRMEGDVFMPEAPKITTHVVRAADVPAWLREFIAEALGCRAVRCAVPSPASGETDEIYIDAARLLSCASSFKERWERLLVRSVPVKLARIVHSDDEDSGLLALRISEFVIKLGGKPPEQIRVSKSEPLGPKRLGAEEGATIVVSSSLVRGRKLTSVARALRDTKGPVIYLIAVARMVSREILQETRENLTYSSNGVRHVCDWAAEIYLPSARPDSFVSWAVEKNALQAWDAAGGIHPEIKRRLCLLMAGREGEGKAGLTNHLFWPDGAGKQLALRDGFALFPERYDNAAVTAADVFLAVTAVLHDLRFGDPRKARLIQGPRHHALLSAKNFDRFNDGIVQASLLRAALPVEIDYTDAPESSSYMLELLLSIFSSGTEQHGEAALEFAISLVTGRLRLASRDQKTLNEFVATDIGKLTPLLAVILRHYRTSSESPNL